ncbi:hypothetical protein [Thalassobaculum litoreum]|uniref:Uncharacterized protein n=1 Tax=Thalassobaculum litoreum DSM 18839 TaxID=1123362 RepID=A0A8G2F2C9_9PROT|nr:hypothetical protein [Thalassobaculum litoreum]SDF46234.1 hypothetical protein SAMN05660686_01442 [Thalassobaculum litoreum DSM 18839]
MPIDFATAISRLLAGYWNAESQTDANPGGFGNNGHKENLPALAEALGVVGSDVATKAGAASGSADDAAGYASTASDAADAAGISAGTAAGAATAAAYAADAAAASAAGLNMPAVSGPDALKYLRVNSEGDGFEVGAGVASEEEAEAGTDTLKLMTPQRVAQAIAALVTGLTVAKGGTGAATFTDGGVLVGNGTGAVQATSAGTSGQVLTSNGAGVDPTFEDVGGGFTSATKQTASSAFSIDFSGIPSGVSVIVLQFDTLTVTGGGDLRVTIGDSGGLEASGYRATSIYIRTTTGVIVSTSAFDLNVGVAAAEFHGHLILTNVSGNSWVATHLGSLGAGTQYVIAGGGHKTLSGTLDRLRVEVTAGNMSGDLNIKYQ